jgi:hypothetical protein
VGLELRHARRPTLRELDSHAILVLLFGVTLIGITSWAFVELAIDRWRGRHRPPPAARAARCPACGGTEFDRLTGGLWDGVDAQGSRAGGMFDYGTCRQCRTRVGRWDDGPPYVVPDEEWEREVALSKAR